MLMEEGEQLLPAEQSQEKLIAPIGSSSPLQSAEEPFDRGPESLICVVVEERKQMKAKRWIALLAGAMICQCSYGEHRHLLPRPQQVQYGSGSVPLRDMEIQFAAQPDAEDQFAAEQLQQWLQTETGRRVSIAAFGNQPDGTLPVVLEREGEKDVPLALPGEKPGPDSREAYDLSITGQGVKIH